MAQLTVQNASTTGLEVTFAAAAAGGDKFQNDGHSIIEIINGGGGDITLTIAANVDNPPPGTAETNATVTVTAGERRHVWVPQAGYNDANGDVNLSYSGVSSVTIAIISLPI